MTVIAVTGASGRLGGLVIRLLAVSPDNVVVALSRRPTAVPDGVEVRIADYDDPEALRRGMAGVHTLVLISSDGEGTRVLHHHLNVVAAARDRGVEHLVALSGLDADIDSPFCYAITNALTERAIRGSGCPFSIVRASIFSEFFSHFLLPARTTGEIRVPMGSGRVSLVSRIDVGHALAAQAQLAPSGFTSDITGPVALDSASIAATTADLWRRAVVDRPLDPSAFTQVLTSTEDTWWTHAYSTMFASIRQQRWSGVSTDLSRLTGRRPRTLSEVLAGPGDADVGPPGP